MQKIKLAYGKGYVNIDFPDSYKVKTLEPPSSGPVISVVEKKVLEILDKPDEGESLKAIVQKAGKSLEDLLVAVIVNDLSRSTPVKEMLPPVLDTLEREGISRGNISVVIATGTHRILSRDEEIYLLGEEIASSYRVESHDCDSPDLVSAGRFSTGNEFLLNRTVYEADLRIGIGEVLFHYFAGFAGGRKSLCPGVAGRSTVMNNHKMMTHPKARLGNIEGNPIHEELMESLEICPLHFIVNAICNHKKEVAAIVGGDPVRAWEEGLAFFRELNTVNISHPSKVVIASAGGFPKDLNLYQAQKAFEMAGHAVEDGGSLVIFAECPETYGSAVFEKWAEKGMDAEEVITRFEKDFELGAHKLYYLAKMSRRINLFLFSSLSQEITESIYCSKVFSWDNCMETLKDLHGDSFETLVIPQGGILLPQVKD